MRSSSSGPVARPRRWVSSWRRVRCPSNRQRRGLGWQGRRRSCHRLFDELRIAQFIDPASSACAGPGPGADSPGGAWGKAPAPRLQEASGRLCRRLRGPCLRWRFRRWRGGGRWAWLRRGCCRSVLALAAPRACEDVGALADHGVIALGRLHRERVRDRRTLPERELRLARGPLALARGLRGERLDLHAHAEHIVKRRARCREQRHREQEARCGAQPRALALRRSPTSIFGLCHRRDDKTSRPRREASVTRASDPSTRALRAGRARRRRGKPYAAAAVSVGRQVSRRRGQAAPPPHG